MKKIKNIILIMSVALFASSFAIGQKKVTGTEDTFDSERVVVVKKDDGAMSAKQQLNALTALEVGEPDSFGKNAKFLGVVRSGLFILTSDCSVAAVGVLGPDDRCYVVTDPTISTTYNELDLGRITIPGKSADNILYGISTGSHNYNMSNNGTASSVGRVSFVPSITMESVAFNDPSAIDPATGLPMNGALRTTGTRLLARSRTLAAGDVENEFSRGGGANTLGFSREYFRQIGLSDSAINMFYKKPVTIKVNMRITTRLISEATFSFGVRFLGN
jgi:hypothetical protein